MKNSTQDWIDSAACPSTDVTVRQTQAVEHFTDDATNTEVAVLFQVIRLAKQVYVYIGLAEDTKSSLHSMSMGMAHNLSTTPSRSPSSASPISTCILRSKSRTQNTDSESQQLAQMLSRRAGFPVLVSYNVPSGSVTDTIRSRIAGFAAKILMNE